MAHTAFLVLSQLAAVVPASPGEPLVSFASSCSAQEQAEGACAEPHSGNSMLQVKTQAKTVATTAGCPVTEYPDLTVSTCGAGYTKPQWMVSNLDADCVDNLVFGRGPVGMMCRNKNFNVGKGVIVVHGDNSDRRDMWTGNGGWGNLFLRRGYVVFSIDYTGADCEVDIAQASTFFQDAANLPSEDFVVEPGNVGLFGFSKGAICSARATIFESASSKAAVCLSGGAANGPAKDVHAGMPPILLMWSNGDCTQDIEKGDNWYTKMTNKGYDMQYINFAKDGMRNAHTQTYKAYPCSQEWATGFFDDHLGVTLEAPTSAPTPTAAPPPKSAAPAPPPASSGSWVVFKKDSKCDNGDSTSAGSLDECLAMAEANGATYATYREKDGKCKHLSECQVKSKDDYTIYVPA